MLTKPLSASQLEAINLEYGLELSYDNATHYRAAQVIYSLAQEVRLRLPAPAADLGADSPAAVPVPAGTALSYPATSDDTAG